MQKHGVTYSILILGFLAICSSWFSVAPAAEHRYQQLVQRSQENLGSVTGGEWISSEIDGPISSFALIFIGSIATVLVTTIVLGIMQGRNKAKLRTTGYVLATSWITLALFLHLFVWNIL